jgi:hypothetical protein
VGALLLPSALALAIAACGSATGALPSSSPVDSPEPSPVVTPRPTAMPSSGPSSSPIPSSPAQEGIKLDVVDPHDVSVIVDNATGYPVRVTSGRAGDGMSVRWGDFKVVNIDASTLRVTWVGLPRDEQVKLKISFDDASGGMLKLTFTQAAPPANSDAIGFDRVIVLSFDTPVAADEVTAAFKPAA